MLQHRAATHRALGEPSRLAIVEALATSDLTAGELREATGLSSNLLAFHLRVLDEAGIVRRHHSEGDRRRRYVSLRGDVVAAALWLPAAPASRAPLFVCTHNSARSQFAAALWRKATGRRATSAGSDPAKAVHPLAVKVAARHGLDLRRVRPRGYDRVGREPDLIVSVCDRALEAGLPFSAARIHWSVPDPVDGDEAAFESVFDDVAARVTRLAAAAA